MTFDINNPNRDTCMNCGRPRGDHMFTRRGALCANGRTSFKIDREAVIAALRAAENEKQP